MIWRIAVGIPVGRGGAGAQPVPFTFTVTANTKKQTSSGTLLQPEVPMGSVGDILIAFVQKSTARTLTPPTDAAWTLSEDVGGAALFYYRVTDGSEGATSDWALDSASAYSVHTARLGGVSAIDIDGSASDVAVSTATAPSVTTTGPSRVLVCAFGASGGRTITPPGSMSGTDQQTSNPASALAYELISAAGATGTRVATYTTATSSRGISTAFVRMTT